LFSYCLPNFKLTYLEDERQISIDALSGLGGGVIESFLSGLVGSAMPKKRAMKVEDIPAKMNILGAKRVRLLYGPYKLKAANACISELGASHTNRRD
jgi:hypothetical protein